MAYLGSSLYAVQLPSQKFVVMVLKFDDELSPGSGGTRYEVSDLMQSSAFMANKANNILCPLAVGGYEEITSGGHTVKIVRSASNAFSLLYDGRETYNTNVYNNGVYIELIIEYAGGEWERTYLSKTIGDSDPYKATVSMSSENSYPYVVSNGTYAVGVTINTNTTFAINSRNIGAVFKGVAEPWQEDTDPYSNLPLSGEDEISGGGSGTVSIPGFPGLSATSTGIIGLFAPSAAEMRQLASFMWTDFGGQGTTTEDILREIVEALKRSISNPLDYVVGLNIIPSQGLSIGAAQNIQFGFVSSGVSMPALSSQYFTVDCGSIQFEPLCGNTFLDYAPYSKFSIYLPYIGVKELDANDCVGHSIGVVYHGDTVTGGVTAYITKDGSVMYQYSGCCALNVPLSSDNWGSTISGAVQIATSMVSGGLSAGAAGVGAAAAQGAANVAANPSLLSPQVQHSGAVSGGAGCMGVQYPFIIREAVRFHSTAGFNKIAGYPSFYKRRLQDVSGYTTVVDVFLDNIPATQGEIEEITELLKGGVYL